MMQRHEVKWKVLTIHKEDFFFPCRDLKDKPETLQEEPSCRFQTYLSPGEIPPLA